MSEPLVLRPVGLRWVDGSADDPADLCAHGDFELRIGADALSEGTEGRGLTLSAAALYLMRTFERPHTKDERLGDLLFPCCGFAMYEVAESEDVLIIGCPNGVDYEIAHTPDGGGVLIRAEEGREWRVGWAEWREAVFGFADRVAAFYAACSPKKPSSDDVPGFRRFLKEWMRRRGKPLLPFQP